MNFMHVLFVCVALVQTDAVPLEIERLRKTLAGLDKVLRENPELDEAYQQRGYVNFKLGKFKESIQDFDKVIELKPDRKASHWQRGISLYYAGRYEEGRKQFEGYQDYDSNDVENAVWRFLCMAKAVGTPKARAAMLKIGDDRRRTNAAGV